MLKKNSILSGSAAGIIFPGLAYIYTELLNGNALLPGKEGIPYLIGIALNLFMIRYFFLRNMENTAKGVLLTTFTLAIVFFYLNRRP